MITRKEVFLSAALGFTLATAWILYAVFTSTSSTAPVGLVFIPIYGTAAAILAITSYYLVKRSWPTRILWLLAVALLGAGFYRKHTLLRTATDPAASAQALFEVFEAPVLFGQEDILVALAQNPAAPPELLRELARRPERPVLIKVAGNGHTDPATLETLAQMDFSYDIHTGLAHNPNLNQAQIDRLLSARPGDFKSPEEYGLYQTFVLATLARRPLLSDPDFQVLLHWPDPEYFLVYGLIESGRADCEWLHRQATVRTDALQGNASSQLAKQNCPGK